MNEMKMNIKLSMIFVLYTRPLNIELSFSYYYHNINNDMHHDKIATAKPSAYRNQFVLKYHYDDKQNLCYA